MSKYSSAMGSGKTTKSASIAKTIIANTNSAKSDKCNSIQQSGLKSKLLSAVIEQVSKTNDN